MNTTIKYLVRAKIIEGRAAPHSSRLESALDVGIEGAPEDTGLDAIESFEVVDVTHADSCPAFSQYSIALRTIAQMWDGETVPEPETYHDAESAFNNGHDVASYEAAKIAREAIAGADVLNLCQETAALRACRLLAEAYGGGEESGGSIKWEDLDEAHEAALAALRGEVEAFEQDLVELERQKLVELGDGTVTLTREGYLEISRRFGPKR